MNEPPNIIIKPAQTNDLQQIIEIANEGHLSDWNERDYQTETIRTDSIFLTAQNSSFQKHSQTIGFVIARLITFESDANNFSKANVENVEKFIAEIFNIAVCADFRRKRIGQMLLDELLTESKARGAIECWLEVRDSNEPAQNFYSKNGFVRVGRRPNYYSNPSEDAVLMNLKLGEIKIIKT